MTYLKIIMHLVFAALLGLSMAASAQDAALPNVLLIGDSISAGYTPAVTRLLQGQANVVRGAGAGGPTTAGIEKLSAILAGRKWAVIHFNWGLHDIKLQPDGEHQVPLPQYEANLKTLLAEMRKTGARLVWASTTPVPEGKQGPPRKKGDEVAYNEAALKLVTAAGAAVDDLYGFALPRLGSMQRPLNVHYTDAGYEQLGKQVADTILKYLPTATPSR
jgi:lysophospholipase L1-like esterase